jgi:Cu(I)/Ag(I) efflux system membrane fusion protein
MQTIPRTLCPTSLAVLLVWAAGPSTPAMRGADNAQAIAADSTDTKTTEFEVPPERLQQIGVTYAPVERGALQATVRVTGTVAVETRRRWEFVTRVEGYVHSLGVAAPGEGVAKGQVLAEIYSPDVTSTENEYIELLRMHDALGKGGPAATAEGISRLIASARARLGQWDVPQEVLAGLEASRKVPSYLTVVSPMDGTVESLGVNQGRHVVAGDPLVAIADLRSVWIWADFYQEDLPLLKEGLPVAVTSSAFPSEGFKGTIALVDPFISETKRTARVRIDAANPRMLLRPDMYVDVELVIEKPDCLSVPVEAVLPTGRHDIVFVDKGAGRLEPRFIEIGRKFGNRYEVSTGLAQGERVVSSANFLIDAESKIQGALKAW